MKYSLTLKKRKNNNKETLIPKTFRVQIPSHKMYKTLFYIYIEREREREREREIFIPWFSSAHSSAKSIADFLKPMTATFFPLSSCEVSSF